METYMKKYDGILICSDIDCTATSSGGTISQENIDAVKYFIQNGGAFTFVSGRHPREMISIKDQFGIQIPLLALNGSVIYDFNKREYIYSELLDESANEPFDYIVNTYPELMSEVLVKKQDHAYEFIKGERLTLEEIIDIFHSVEKNEVFFNIESEEVAKNLRHELLKNEKYTQKLDFVRSWPRCLEILPINGNKGSGVRVLKEYLGNITKTVCIGDYENDISMIKYADIGYAVANACDELKDAADKITVSRNESALSKIISEL